MNKRYTMPLALLLIIVYVWLTPQASAQSLSNTTVYVDGQRISTTAIVQNGLQLVPASFFRRLNVSVNWSERYRAVVLTTDTIEIGFPAGQRYSDYRRDGKSTWLRDSLVTRTTLNKGTAYVPLAYTAKKIGLHIQYNSQLRAAVITTGNDTNLMLVNAEQPSAEEMKWLYQITEAEAGGETYDGKVAVAASILNRVDHPDWPYSIIDTIFQVEYINGRSYYQYSPVLDKRIYTVTPSQESKRAVQDAVNGSDPSLGAVVFYNPDKTDNKWVRSRPTTVKIGNHMFAK